MSPPSAGIHVALSRSSVTALHSCAVAAGSLSLPGLTSLPHSFHALAVSLTTSCRPLLHTALTRLTEDCALASVLVACQDPDAIADGLAGARHRKDRFPSHARRSRPCRGARNRRSLWRGVYPGCVDVVLELCHPRPINIYLHPRPLPHSHTILIISCIGRGSCSLWLRALADAGPHLALFARAGAPEPRRHHHAWQRALPLALLSFRRKRLVWCIHFVTNLVACNASTFPIKIVCIVSYMRSLQDEIRAEKCR